MKHANLMLHCGASEVERKDLSGIVLPPATDTYVPIGHDTVLDMAEDKLAEMGFRFGSTAFSLTKEGNRFFGLAELHNGNGELNTEDYVMVAAFRNSIDKSFPAAMGLGSHVFVCDNLAFTAEVKFSRKHTTHIMRDLPDLVARAVSQTKAFGLNQKLRFEHYQNFMFDKITADHAIVEMLRQGAVNTSRIEKVVREWDNPSRDHGDGRTAWRLFNAATEALKPSNKGVPLQDLPPRTIALQGVMDQFTEFVPAADTITADDWEG